MSGYPDNVIETALAVLDQWDEPEVGLERARRGAAQTLAVEVRRMRTGQPEQHCPTCICGKRAPVQGDQSYRLRSEDEIGHGPGSITWEEHLLAYSGYASRYGTVQSAERLAERGGFSYGELVMFLGREPTTWRPR